MRPRVLRIITRMSVGGPSTHALLADRGLAERGWETLLVHGTVEPWEVEIDVAAAGIATRRIPSLQRSISPATDARAFAEIVRLVRRYRPHVIHTHLSKAGLLGRLAAMGVSRAPRVHTFHGTLFGGYFGPTATGGIVRLERFLGARTTRTIAISELQRIELLDYGVAPESRIVIVPLGLDIGRFAGADRAAERRALGIAPEALVVVAVGRLVPIKRLERLVSAIATIRAGIPAVRLYLVGDGDARPSIEAAVDAAGIRAITTFAGWTADSRPWFAAADVVALTSDREGTPLSLIEAAASGRPIVATAVGGVPDVVADGVSGFLVRPDDEAALADRLRRLLSDERLRHQMGKEGRGSVERFDARHLADRLDTLYRELLTGRTAPRSDDNPRP